MQDLSLGLGLEKVFVIKMLFSRDSLWLYLLGKKFHVLLEIVLQYIDYIKSKPKIR